MKKGAGAVPPVAAPVSDMIAGLRSEGVSSDRNFGARRPEAWPRRRREAAGDRCGRGLFPLPDVPRAQQRPGAGAGRKARLRLERWNAV
eukprot:7666181-Pyramimonas_sp.AAC.1